MSGLDDVLARMWAGFADLARSRVDALEAYARAYAAGDDDPALRAEARSAAHKLAGALGSYGRAGSDEASQLDLLLRDGSRRDPDEVTALVAALRRSVDA